MILKVHNRSSFKLKIGSVNLSQPFEMKTAGKEKLPKLDSIIFFMQKIGLSLRADFLVYVKTSSLHTISWSVTLHMGRTGFPVCHFPKLKQTPPKFTPKFPATNCHGGLQLEKHPAGSGLSANRIRVCPFSHTVVKQVD